MDGVRVYLPADNRLDFNRFLTPTSRRCRSQKGYVSVLNGPGGMGGAINLVSRKPTKEVELEGRVGAVFDGDLARMGQWSTYAYAGTRQKGYYAQISGTIARPGPLRTCRTTSRPRLRPLPADRSSLRKRRQPRPFGFRGLAHQHQGRHHAQRHRRVQHQLHHPAGREERAAARGGAGRSQGPRYWDWPYWDMSSALVAVEDADRRRLLLQDQRLLQHLQEPAQLVHRRHLHHPESQLAGLQQLLRGLCLRRLRRDGHQPHSDEHPEGCHPLPPRRPLGAQRRSHRPIPTQRLQVHEPWQDSVVDTWSFAVENTFHATRYFDIVTGVSYDMDSVQEAQEFNSTTRQPVVESRAEHQRLERPGGGNLQLQQYRQGARRRVEPHPLPDAVRPLQHSLRHARGQSQHPARACDQLRSRDQRHDRRYGARLRRGVLFGSAGFHSERIRRGFGGSSFSASTRTASTTASSSRPIGTSCATCAWAAITPT